MWETAVSHAIDSGDWEWTADLVAKAYRPLIAKGHVATWQRWLAQIPARLVQSRPVLLVQQGWAAFLRGEFHHAEMMLAAARKALQATDLTPKQRVLRGELATYLATIAFFREAPDEIIQAAEEALAYLPPEALDSRARATGALGLGVSLAGDTRRAMMLYKEAVVIARSAGNPLLLAHTLEVVADGQYHTGQLQAAGATCRDIIALGTQDRAAPFPFAGNGRVRLAAIYLEWRQLTQAEEEMSAGLALIREGGLGYNALPDLCTQVRLRQTLGDDEGALVVLRQAEALFHQNPSRIAAVQLTACAVQFWLNAGDVATAVSWIDGQPFTGTPIQLTNLPIIAQEVQQISLARVRLAQRQPDAVLAIYAHLHDQALSAGRLARVIEIGLLAVLAYEMKGETAVALDALNQILKLTRPEGYVQIFVDSGTPMLQLLRQLPASKQTDYVQTLRRAFPDDLQTVSSALVEPLSPRELEVLRLIAAGLSNKQITTELTVSLNTVKKHTTHIYSKLGVKGRTQAIARARELHLI
jgi:LuxR family maltose regulon positive regulatory protein